MSSPAHRVHPRWDLQAQVLHDPDYDLISIAMVMQVLMAVMHMMTIQPLWYKEHTLRISERVDGGHRGRCMKSNKKLRPLLVFR